MSMNNKDKQAKKRVDEEIELKRKISDLLRDFSEKYDVQVAGMSINKNEWYPSTIGDPPMYNIDLYWSFDYLGH